MDRISDRVAVCSTFCELIVLSVEDLNRLLGRASSKRRPLPAMLRACTALQEDDSEALEEAMTRGVPLSGLAFDPRDRPRPLLHEACLLNSYRCVETLIQKKADVNRKDWSGRTPMQIAHSHGHRKVMTSLQNFGGVENVERMLS